MDRSFQFSGWRLECGEVGPGSAEEHLAWVRSESRSCGNGQIGVTTRKIKYPKLQNSAVNKRGIESGGFGAVEGALWRPFIGAPDVVSRVRVPFSAVSRLSPVRSVWRSTRDPSLNLPCWIKGHLLRCPIAIYSAGSSKRDDNSKVAHNSLGSGTRHSGA